MKKFVLFCFMALLLSGCATYKFQHGKVPFDKGYVALRDNYMIPDYTLGADNIVPDDLALAQERFKRRRKMVEHYYKQMGLIDNHFKLTVWNHLVLLPKALVGMLKLPFIAAEDRKYERDAAYREKVRARDDAEDKVEEERVAQLREKIKAYVQSDLVKEGAMPAPAPVKAKKAVEETVVPEEVKPVVEVQLEPAVVEQVESVPVVEQVKAKPVVEKAKPAVKVKKEKVKKEKVKKEKVKKEKAPKPVKQPVVKEKQVKAPKVKTLAPGQEVKAVISAVPVKGYSPLRVKFSAAKSASPIGRIVSYTWEFGDGDSSTLKNPTNTYWSVSFEPRKYSATLTVQDEQGNTAQDIVEIEVLNK